MPSGFEYLVVYAYPMTGLPGVELPDGWDEIPGARGCTPESCGFRDHAAELAKEGAAVLGVSTQTTAYQREVSDRLGLPYPLLSDSDLELTRAMRLPSFTMEMRRNEVEPPSGSTCHGTARTCGYDATISFPVLAR